LEGEYPSTPIGLSAFARQMQTILDIFSNGNVKVMSCETIPTSETEETVETYAAGLRLIISETDPETVGEDGEAL